MESRTVLSLDACHTKLHRKTGSDSVRRKVGDMTSLWNMHAHKSHLWRKPCDVCGLISNLRGAPSAISKAVMPKDHRSLWKQEIRDGLKANSHKASFYALFILKQDSLSYNLMCHHSFWVIKEWGVGGEGGVQLFEHSHTASKFIQPTIRTTAARVGLVRRQWFVWS